MSSRIHQEFSSEGLCNLRCNAASTTVSSRAQNGKEVPFQEKLTGCASDDSLAAERKEVQRREGDPIVNAEVF